MLADPSRRPVYNLRTPVIYRCSKLTVSNVPQTRTQLYFLSTSMHPRAEHIGSLKRPDALLQKRDDFRRGKCTAAELHACEDEAVAAIIKMQLRLGLDVITDGEFRRSVSSPSWK